MSFIITQRIIAELSMEKQRRIFITGVSLGISMKFVKHLPREEYA